MVKIINAHLRQGENGSFVSFELQGEVEMVQSHNTGRFYATARRCFISSTFDLETAKGFIGSKIAGTIARVEAEPYDYTVPETGEVIKLAHSYTYVPEEKPVASPRVEVLEVA